MTTPFTASRLLAFARELQRASTFRELLDITRAEAKAACGYEHVWLFVSDDADVKEVRMIDYAGSQRERAWEIAPVLKVEGDRLMEEIATSDAASGMRKPRWFSAPPVPWGVGSSDSTSGGLSTSNLA